MNNDEKLESLFNGYAKAFDELDFKQQATYFADSFMMAGPKGTVSNSKDEFLKKAEEAAGFYKSIGQTGAEMLSITTTPLSDDYALAKIHWGVTFKQTGDVKQEFDVSYVVFSGDAEPKIVLVIAHQDEQEMMKKLGKR